MEINRNQYFMVGLVLVLLGIQFRSVDRFVLNQEVTRFINERRAASAGPQAAWAAAPTQFMVANMPTGNHVIQPPDWLGFALLSVGAVLILHSLAMKKPEGGG